ncbi:hypothetical protein CL617_02950 [archaeon]|nr:hypothetical protein [archaeon]|tara:strand:+ start:7088 stop:7330 length:243 start_codon:yes stop_codon:yes gene_type:complete
MNLKDTLKSRELSDLSINELETRIHQEEVKFRNLKEEIKTRELQGDSCDLLYNRLQRRASVLDDLQETYNDKKSKKKYGI